MAKPKTHSIARIMLDAPDRLRDAADGLVQSSQQHHREAGALIKEAATLLDQANALLSPDLIIDG
jgi:hypothetical protein